MTEQSNGSLMAQSKQQLTQFNKLNPLTGGWIAKEEHYIIAQNYDKPRIKTFNNAEMNNVLKMVGRWRVYVGIQNEASPEELVMVTKFIHQEFGAQLSLEEIEDCIQKSVTGKLGVDPKPYNSFSPLYVSSMLNAFIEHRNKEVAEIRKLQEKYEQQRDEEYKRSPEYGLKTLSENIVAVFESVKQGKEFFDFGNVISKWLVKTKRIAVNDAERENAKEYANNRIEMERMAINNQLDKGIRKSLLVSNPEDNFETYYRDYFTQKYFLRYDKVEDILKTLSLKDVQ